jgi:hypothetical protein
MKSLPPWLQRWNRFWFAPADPTPLGLLRICCGVVVLGVHLLYTPNLYVYFGKGAWLDEQAMKELLTEYPFPGPPGGWDEQQALRKLPKLSPEPPADLEDQAARDKWKADYEKWLKYVTKWGLDPRAAPVKGYTIWSLWFQVADPTWMAVVHGVALVIFLLFLAGCCTRITSVLAWLAALSYIHRSPNTLFGADTVMNVALLYLMLGPSGAALSVDRLLQRWWLARRGKVQAPPQPSAGANFVLRLFQIHFCLIYAASGLSKLQGSSWWNGSALWYTVVNPAFAPVGWARYLDLISFLTAHRWLWEIVFEGLTFSTLALEISFPLLVWSRSWRWLMIAAAVLLHTGIGLTMGLATFGLLMLSMLLAFIPAEEVHVLLRTLAGWRDHVLAPLRRPAVAAAGKVGG